MTVYLLGREVSTDELSWADYDDGRPFHGCGCRVTDTNPPCECECEAAIAYWQANNDLSDAWEARYPDPDAAFDAWYEDQETGWKALIQ